METLNLIKDIRSNSINVIFWLKKIWVAFAIAKATNIFSAKKRIKNNFNFTFYNKQKKNLIICHYLYKIFNKLHKQRSFFCFDFVCLI